MGYWMIGLLQEVRDLEPQLEKFDIRSSDSFCCSHDHKHPKTQETLPCDRDLIYAMLKDWYGTDGDVHEEHLERLNHAIHKQLKRWILHRLDSAVLPRRTIFLLMLGWFLAGILSIFSAPTPLCLCFFFREDSSKAALIAVRSHLGLAEGFAGDLIVRTSGPQNFVRQDVECNRPKAVRCRDNGKRCSFAHAFLTCRCSGLALLHGILHAMVQSCLGIFHGGLVLLYSWHYRGSAPEVDVPAQGCCGAIFAADRGSSGLGRSFACCRLFDGKTWQHGC